MELQTQKRRPAGGRRLPVRRDDAGRRLISHIDLLRMRISAAAKAWKEAKQQASRAKRRRKLAKLMARRAKKDAKTAKGKLDELREALAKAQERAATTASRPSTHKPNAGQHTRAIAGKNGGSGHPTRKLSRATRKPGGHLPPVPMPASETIFSGLVGVSMPENYEEHPAGALIERIES